jgi:large subunit ribosomal protein L29
MKAKEFRELGVADLEKKVQELNQEWFNHRYQMHPGHLDNNARVGQVKRDIARVKTVLQEKQVN